MFADRLRKAEAFGNAKENAKCEGKAACEAIREVGSLAEKGPTSVSAVVGEAREKPLVEDDDYERAVARAIARMKVGFHMGGGPITWDRDDLHSRGEPS